ncbi:MAG: hypothetical protein ACJ74W_23850 [Pyrinomonadaceae bacterium]
MNMDAILDNARLALENYLRNRTAGIYIVMSPMEADVGSAICIEIGGRLFIATAAHNFRGMNAADSVTLFSANRSSAIPLTVIQANYRQDLPDDEADIAWLEIDPVSASNSDLTGVSLGSVTPYPTPDIAGFYMVNGFPAGLKREERRNANDRNFVVPLALYITHAVPQEDLANGDIVLSYARTAIGPTGIGEMAQPHGMSGGGIWHIPPPDDPIIWMPERLRLIGITTVYFRRRDEVRGVRMHQWLQLLYADLPELRPTLGPLLERTN